MLKLVQACILKSFDFIPLLEELKKGPYCFGHWFILPCHFPYLKLTFNNSLQLSFNVCMFMISYAQHHSQVQYNLGQKWKNLPNVPVGQEASHNCVTSVSARASVSRVFHCISHIYHWPDHPSTNTHRHIWHQTEPNRWVFVLVWLRTHETTVI